MYDIITNRLQQLEWQHLYCTLALLTLQHYVCIILVPGHYCIGVIFNQKIPIYFPFNIKTSKTFDRRMFMDREILLKVHCSTFYQNQNFLLQDSNKNFIFNILISEEEIGTLRKTSEVGITLLKICIVTMVDQGWAGELHVEMLQAGC